MKIIYKNIGIWAAGTETRMAVAAVFFIPEASCQ